MKIDLSPFENNEAIKNLIREKLHLGSDILLDLTLDRVHALNELSRGISDIHPHKRSIATLGNLPTPLRELAKGFAKQGFVVQEIKLDLRGKFAEQKCSEQIAALKKDTLFVLGAEIEPLTGLLYPWDLIRDELLKKNLFLIKYFSPASLRAGFKKPSHGLEAFVVAPHTGGMCFVLRGERCVTEPLLWGEVSFDREEVIRTCDDLAAAARFGHHDENTLAEFEKRICEMINKSAATDVGPLAWSLPFWCPRVNDRAVLFIRGVNGDALVHEMEEAFGSSITARNFTTADSVYWQDPHPNAWLPNLGFSPEEARCSLAIAIELLNTQGLEAKLLATVSRLQKLSGTI